MWCVLEKVVNDLSNKCLARRKYLIKVIKCIHFLARQGLAFRSNDSNDNLTQLFELLHKNDPTLSTCLDKESHLEPGQHKYMRNDIQNELIEFIAKEVLAKKLELIRSNNFLE